MRRLMPLLARNLSRLISVTALFLGSALPGCACDPGGPQCAPGSTLDDQGTCVASGDDGPECAEGTEEVDGECVSIDIACGNGTVLTDAGCRQPQGGPVCGEGTERVGNECVAVRPPECGPGTELINGECLPAGTQLPCAPACDLGTYCAATGVCVPTPRPAEWLCFAEMYRDEFSCDCGCGAFDPDCLDPALPVSGCASGVCNLDGTCEACVPSCGANECGDDGCGGSCGECIAPGLNRCVGGVCTACTAQCDDAQCGDDGCGGSCGECGEVFLCTLGQCVPPPETASCIGRCGEVAPDGCSCQGGCDVAGTCCADVGFCGCLPNCEDRECGPDGCGGTCGGCLDEELCTSAQLCTDDPCDPNPCSSYGTCIEADGRCACALGYDGDACDACAEGYTGFPTCVIDLCAEDENCNEHGTCQSQTGVCDCEAGFAGAACGACADSDDVYPDCSP